MTPDIVASIVWAVLWIVFAIGGFWLTVAVGSFVTGFSLFSLIENDHDHPGRGLSFTFLGVLGFLLLAVGWFVFAIIQAIIAAVSIFV